MGVGEKGLVLELRDELAELLGARRPGESFVYTYDDAVKLAGHSCPTVAGAYALTVVALRALFHDATPLRGVIDVTFGFPAEDAFAGPASQVVGLVTGAAGPTGFAGLLGRYRRRDRLSFDPTLDGWVRFARTDRDEAIDVAFDAGAVPSSPELDRLLGPVLLGRATAADRERFAALWQERVGAILADPERVVRRRVSRSRSGGAP